MNKKYYFGGLGALVGVLVLAAPAHAFSLNFQTFFSKYAPVEQTQAQEAGEITAPAESVVPLQPINQNQQPMPPDQIQPPQPINNDNTFGGGNNMMPNQPPRPDGNMPPGGNMMPSGPNNMPQFGGGGPGQMGGPSEEQMAKQQAQRLKDIKRTIKYMKTAIATFEKMMAKGSTLSDALKAKITQAKELTAKIDSAGTGDEITNDDMDTLRDLMNDLQEEQQSMQRLTEFRRNITFTERGVKMFETQLTRLQKQKVAIPADVTDNLSKIKQLIATVKTAASWDEMQTAGVEDLGDLMNTLNESRNTLEMLARWPQTIKQMDKEVLNLDRQVKRDKTIVDRLMKKEIDLTENYNKFVEMAGKLKAARDDAAAKMAAGDSDGAFTAAQDDFFGQIEETYQNARIIETMNGLGMFASSFKSQLNKAKQTINQLKKKKIDVTELQAIYDDTKTKGDETLALIKVKPIDEEAIIAAMEELGNLRVDFGNKVSELEGDDAADMPWQQGPQQFKAVQMAPNFDQYFPQQNQPNMMGGNGGGPNGGPGGGPNGGPTCNVNGVEMPGACQ